MGCILKNINQLDTEAQEILRNKHEVTYTQDISSLSSDTNMIYPSWWVFPSGIEGAAVVAVGPAGILLRAQVARGNDSTVIDIPYSFGHVARDSISLRSITLQAIQ